MTRKETQIDRINIYEVKRKFPGTNEHQIAIVEQNALPAYLETLYTSEFSVRCIGEYIKEADIC